MNKLIDLTTTIVKSIVDDEEGIEISENKTEKGMLIEIKVSEGDVGKVIGKKGRVATAIRTIVMASGAKGGQRVMVNVFNKPRE